MLIAEAIYDDGDESFDVQLPSDFTYYERSWTHALYDSDPNWSSNSTLYLDDVSISYLSTSYPSEWMLAHGSLTLAQLPPGISHTIRIHLYEHYEDDTFCGMALVYQEVP